MDKSTILSLVGLVISVSVALILFFAGKNQIEPRYSVKKSELLAEVVNEEPKLRIMWENTNVPNVRSVDLAIWNAGDEYLDVENISKTDPLRIVLPEKAELFYAKVVNTSRDKLRFELSDAPGDPTGSEINIRIVGDEALEQNDGVLVRILYSCPVPGEFRVLGRIKGAKSGFELVNWSTIAPMNLPKGLMYAILPLMLIMLFTAFSVVHMYGKRLKTDPSKFCILCFANAILLIAITVYVFFRFVKPFFFGLPWLA